MHGEGWFVVLSCVVLGVWMGGWQLGFPLGTLMVASLLVHEIGHMITGHASQGACARVRAETRRRIHQKSPGPRRREEILIAASGPLMNLLVVVPLIFVPRLGYQLALCNLVLGVVNLSAASLQRRPAPVAQPLGLDRNQRPESSAERCSIPLVKSQTTERPTRACLCAFAVRGWLPTAADRRRPAGWPRAG